MPAVGTPCSHSNTRTCPSRNDSSVASRLKCAVWAPENGSEATSAHTLRRTPPTHGRWRIRAQSHSTAPPAWAPAGAAALSLSARTSARRRRTKSTEPPYPSSARSSSVMRGACMPGCSASAAPIAGISGSSCEPLCAGSSEGGSSAAASHATVRRLIPSLSAISRCDTPARASLLTSHQSDAFILICPRRHRATTRPPQIPSPSRQCSPARQRPFRLA